MGNITLTRNLIPPQTSSRLLAQIEQHRQISTILVVGLAALVGLMTT